MPDYHVQTSYHVTAVHWTSEPDDLVDGCDLSRCVSNTCPVNISSDNVHELVASLFEWINAKVDWEDVELDACEEPGRLDIQVYEKSPGDGDAYEQDEVMPALERQAADKVRCRLTGATFVPSVWLTCYTVYVGRRTVETGFLLDPDGTRLKERTTLAVEPLREPLAI